MRIDPLKIVLGGGGAGEGLILFRGVGAGRGEQQSVPETILDLFICYYY